MKVMPSPTPSSVSTWLAVNSPTTSCRSSPSVATLSPPPPSVRSFVTSRRSSAMSLSTSSRRCPPPLPRGSLPAFLPRNGGLRSSRDHLQLHHEVRRGHQEGPVRQHRHVRRHHHVPRYR